LNRVRLHNKDAQVYISLQDGFKDSVVLKRQIYKHQCNLIKKVRHIKQQLLQHRTFSLENSFSLENEQVNCLIFYYHKFLLKISKLFYHSYSYYEKVIEKFSVYFKTFRLAYKIFSMLFLKFISRNKL
jgi:hypothetical protein